MARKTNVWLGRGNGMQWKTTPVCKDGRSVNKLGDQVWNGLGRSKRPVYGQEMMVECNGRLRSAKIVERWINEVIRSEMVWEAWKDKIVDWMQFGIRNAKRPNVSSKHMVWYATEDNSSLQRSICGEWIRYLRNSLSLVSEGQKTICTGRKEWWYAMKDYTSWS